MKNKTTRLTYGTASGLLQKVIDRCHNAELENKFLPLLVRAWLFGSFARGEQRPHDVDICVQLEWRPETSDAPEGFGQVVLDYAWNSGREFKTHFEAMYWPQVEVIRHVKQRSTGMSVHLYHKSECDIYDHPETRLIYEHELADQYPCQLKCPRHDLFREVRIPQLS